jgi:predicted Zn finger-like uncharacterized protein
MYSRCPHCDAQQELTAQQLRDSRGLLHCVSCHQPFDALLSLSEQADEVVEPASTNIVLPQQQNTESVWRWRVGSLMMLLALLGQVVYFEGESLGRQPEVYATLLQACETLGCALPAYKNSDDWAVSHSDLQVHLDKRYLVTAALTNQAGFAQALPILKLTLKDFNDQPVAERLFAPQQYASDAALSANQTTQIRLPLVFSTNEVGGFTLSLI